MKRRPRRAVPAALTALVLLATCVFIAGLAIQLITGTRPWVSYDAVATALNRTHWDDLGLALAGGGVALIGLVMLLAAILPGKATVLPVAGDFDTGVSRRSLYHTLHDAAATVDGVGRAKLKLRRRKIAARVHTERTMTEGLTDAVHAALEQRISQINLAARPAVKVTLRSSKGTS